MSSIGAVQSFWDANPCGSQLSEQTDRARYFAEIEARRYEHEPHIRKVAKFTEYRGKQVLEIGTGIGTDGLQFQNSGASYTGIDLTWAGPKLVKEQFGLAGYTADLTVGNAEVLPFADSTFDHIYSFGVIHHSPLTETIVSEMLRTLKPGGTFTVMLYNRTSINYYVEIMFLRKILRSLLYPAFMPKALSVILGLDQRKLEKHRELSMSIRKMSKADWISINTDGPDCPLAKVYSESEALNLFSQFADVKTDVWFFDRTHWPIIGRILPEAFVAFLGRHWGWHRMVYGIKPIA